jgi:nitroreductase
VTTIIHDVDIDLKLWYFGDMSYQGRIVGGAVVDLQEGIKSRRTVRKFQDKEVPTELMLQAIELASWAPNPGNGEVWRFFVVKNKELITKMADAVQANADKVASWPESEQLGDVIKNWARGASGFRAAAAVIGVALPPVLNPGDRALRLRGEADPEAKQMMANRAGINASAQTAAAVIDHLQIALSSLGLGCFWGAGAMLARKELGQLLGLPEGYELYAIVPVGYPAEAPTAGPRKPVSELATVIE